MALFKKIPQGKAVYIGVWEFGKFIGALVFRNSGNRNIGSPYNLSQWEITELSRVAIFSHKSSVSKILSIAFKMIKKQSEGIRLIISFADIEEGHVGGIYQASNFIYTGTSSNIKEFYIDGKWLHQRSFVSSDWSKYSGIDTSKLPSRISLGKHRYLYPLDDAMRKQIEPLRKPYPKRGTGETDNAPAPKRETEGASPIVPLLEE